MPPISATRQASEVAVPGRKYAGACFSDQVSHAALSGQYLLEQTLHLPVGSDIAPVQRPGGARAGTAHAAARLGLSCRRRLDDTGWQRVHPRTRDSRVARSWSRRSRILAPQAVTDLHVDTSPAPGLVVRACRPQIGVAITAPNRALREGVRYIGRIPPRTAQDWAISRSRGCSNAPTSSTCSHISVHGPSSVSPCSTIRSSR